MQIRTILLQAVMLVLPLGLMAQDDNEYKMEIGVGAGLVSYEGDFNGNITSGAQPMFSVVARRVFNPYMGLRLDLSFGKLKGSSANVDTWYPETAGSLVEFSNSLTDLSLVYEYNFWPYGTGREYRGARKLTPFIFLGLGATFVKAQEENVFTANVPLGLGLKYKIGPRVNLGVEWTAHFSMSDKLDGVVDPLYVKSTGLFKNTDCYTTLRATLTYSFMAKCKICNKND